MTDSPLSLRSFFSAENKNVGKKIHKANENENHREYRHGQNTKILILQIQFMIVIVFVRSINSRLNLDKWGRSLFKQRLIKNSKTG